MKTWTSKTTRGGDFALQAKRAPHCSPTHGFAKPFKIVEDSIPNFMQIDDGDDGRQDLLLFKYDVFWQREHDVYKNHAVAAEWRTCTHLHIQNVFF